MILRQYVLRVGALLSMIPALSLAAAPDVTRSRLLTAITETQELIKSARESESGSLVEARFFDEKRAVPERRFPTTAQVTRYTEQRPWFSQYLLFLSYDFRHIALPHPAWPGSVDGPALRQLLSDSDPAVRGLAVEALATLHDPEDVPRIAKLLEDKAESAPALGWNTMVSSVGLPEAFSPPGPETLVLLRSWQSRRVCAYARAALKLMTGQKFVEGGKPTFAEWWERNHGGTDRIWYWQERLHRDLTVAETSVAFPEYHTQTWEAFYAEQKHWRDETEARLDAARSAIGAELEKLPVETELKVRLLAINRYSTILGSDLGEPLMPTFACRRATPGRLMELMERKNLWTDVEVETYPVAMVITSIMNQAQHLFTRQDVPRLSGLQAWGNAFGWKAQAALFVGIARLLPPAPADRLNLPDTQDGMLREGIRSLDDVQESPASPIAEHLLVCGLIARELVRIGLPRHADFLAEQFFAEHTKSGGNDMRTAILAEFIAPPHCPEKKAFLTRLLLDPRFEPLWREPRLGFGAGLHRGYALSALNAFAGKQVVSDMQAQDLADSDKGPLVLPVVLQQVRAALIPDAPQPSAK